MAAIEPVPQNCVSTVEERTKEDREKWWKMGLKAIYEGKLGVVLLSGGQVLLIIDAVLFLFLGYCVALGTKHIVLALGSFSSK